MIGSPNAANAFFPHRHLLGIEALSAVEIERLLKYTVRDGKLAECWVYDEDQRLVDELLA